MGVKRFFAPDSAGGRTCLRFSIYWLIAAHLYVQRTRLKSWLLKPIPQNWQGEKGIGKHTRQWLESLRYITVHYGAGSSWLRLETGRRLVGRSQRGHFGRCPALPCLALGRTPHSHAVYPTRLYPCKTAADKLMRGMPPKLTLATYYPKNHRM